MKKNKKINVTVSGTFFFLIQRKNAACCFCLDDGSRSTRSTVVESSFVQKTDSQSLHFASKKISFKPNPSVCPASRRCCLCVPGGTVQSKSYSFSSSTSSSSSNASRKVGRYVVVQQWDVENQAKVSSQSTHVVRFLKPTCFCFCLLALQFLLKR